MCMNTVYEQKTQAVGHHIVKIYKEVKTVEVCEHCGDLS